ncbi:MAG: hypothetical protein U5L96_16125 [Owenweeksia sp.]|nr:hypothetical protein [Owenweeksia sp.]
MVGIALTDPSAQLRLEALRQAHELSAPGQRKLQGTITRLSEQDPSEKVRQSAEKLVQKYYN